MQDELLDIVNDHDKVVGTILRSKHYKHKESKRGITRAAEILIQNDHGQLWIPTRAAHKLIAPGALDYSAGGHVSAGETYVDAALREIQEELNLHLTAADLIVARKFEPSEIRYFRTLYIYRSNQSPNYNIEDFVSAEWLTPRQLMDKLEAGVPAKLSMRETITCLL